MRSLSSSAVNHAAPPCRCVITNTPEIMYGRVGRPFREYCRMVITARKRSFGQGNVFTSSCHSVHRGVAIGFPACITSQMTRGSLHWGVCIQGVPHSRRVCIQGGLHKGEGLHPGGALHVVGGWGLGRSHKHYIIRSISGRCASYLNAFLFLLFSESNDTLSQKAAHVIFYKQTLVFFTRKILH